MHFYRILDVDANPVRHEGYVATLSIAQHNATLYARTHICDLRIELVDSAIDKESLVNILNGDNELRGTVLRTWKRKPRGGLTEVPNGE